MKEFFIDKRFSSDSRALIVEANSILDEYEAEGYDLSLRQLYYVFIARDLFPDTWIDAAYNAREGLPPDTKNTDKNYKRLGDLISDARLAGEMDWDMIKDRGREAITNPHWKDPADFLTSVAPQHNICLWDNQDVYVEVMVEKQALEGVLEPVCRALDVTFTANKGYSSSSAMYEAGKRIVENGYDKDGDKRRCVVFYLGDHDPSGIDMTRDVEDRLNMFAQRGIEVERLALNLNQIRTLKPPRNPAKTKDPRAKEYIRQFGHDSWELDAIEPRQLAQIVQIAILGAVTDKTAWTKDNARQKADRETLVKMAQDYSKKKRVPSKKSKPKKRK